MHVWIATHPRLAALFGIALAVSGRALVLSLMDYDHHIDDPTGTLLAMAAVGGVGAMGRTGADPQTIRNSPTAFAYADAAQDFQGVDLEHFVHAQMRLAERLLTQEQLRALIEALLAGHDQRQQLLAWLTEDSSQATDQLYAALYDRLLEHGYTAALLDLINNRTYTDPRLAITIIGQNPNPRAQGVYEAISNSLDALGLHIGQFGKGVKQILDWLAATGEDRLDVYTKTARGHPYQLTILKDARGQSYLQLRAISEEAWVTAVGRPLASGATVLRVTMKNSILPTDAQLDATHRNSQAALFEGIHRRFPYVTEVRITTQQGAQPPQPVNGFAEKRVLAGARAPTQPPEATGKFVHVAVTDHTITVTDNGHGMNAEVLSRMFVPVEGTKTASPLGGEARRKELARVAVVHDATLPHCVSFARSGEVVVSLDIPDTIHPQATLPGGLMVEFGRLLDVPESRDRVILPVGLEPGETSNFQLGAEHAIAQVIANTDLSVEERITIVNTIIIGLDGLIQGNEHYAHAIKAIRATAQRHLAPLLDQLRGAGVVLLPHDWRFAKLAIPQGKRAMFLHEKLFDWQGLLNLRPLGAEAIPGIGRTVTHDGLTYLQPIVVVPFTPESVAGVAAFDASWHTWSEEARLPLINTPELLVVPPQLGARLLELAKQRRRGPLSEAEEREYASHLQRLQIVTAEEVVTSYELTTPKANLIIMPGVEFARSEGQFDSPAVNAFLTTPPPSVRGATAPPAQPPAGAVPSDANQHLILMDDGTIRELGTARIVWRFSDTVTNATLQPLRRGYYKLVFDPAQGERGVETLVHLQSDGQFDIQAFGHSSKGNRILLSPDHRFTAEHDAFGRTQGRVIDMETGLTHHIDNAFATEPPSTPASSRYTDLQFSRGYLTYLETDVGAGRTALVVVNLERKQVVKRVELSGSRDELEYAITPQHHALAIARNTRTGRVWLVNLAYERPEADAVVDDVRALHVTNTYAALVDGRGEMRIYFPRSWKLLTRKDVGNLPIQSIETIHFAGEFSRYQIACGKRGPPKQFYIVNHNGHIIEREPAEPSNIDYIEVFTQDGHIAVRSHTQQHASVPPAITLGPSGDVLQRPDRPGIYRYPQFNLIIDHRDPAHPVAIDPKTGQRFRSGGMIVHYNSEKQQLAYIDTGNELFTQTAAGGFSSLGHVVAVAKRPPAQPERGDVVVTLHHDADEPWSWTLWDFSQPEPGRRLTTIPLEFRQVVFDGTYFVFANPTTGDVVYLDPEKPEQSIFVSAQGSGLEAQGQENVLLATRPTEAPNRYVVVRPQGVAAQLWDAQTGALIADADNVTHALPIDERQVAVFSQDLSHDTLAVYRAGVSGTWSKQTVVPSQSGYDSIEAHAKYLIVMAHRHGAAHQGVRVYDLRTSHGFPSQGAGESYAAAVHLSASGRYSIHKQADGTLVYYDHNEADPQPKEIAQAGAYTEYRVHDRADVVLMRNSRLLGGKDTLFNLAYGLYPAALVDHIEIDSSGTIALVKVDDKIVPLNLKQGDVLTGLSERAEQVNVASTDQWVYVLMNDVDVSIYDKHTGEKVHSSNTAIVLDNTFTPLPRFWERYELEHKTIWDRHTNQPAMSTLGAYLYREQPSTNATITTRLRGDWLIREERGTFVGSRESYRIRLVNLVDHREFAFASETELRLEALQGDHVWYARASDGRITHVRLYPLRAGEGEVQGQVLANAGHTALLLTHLTHPNGVHLIDADGISTDLTTKIPSGFVPTDVDGDYFVFTNPSTGELRWLDPKQDMQQTQEAPAMDSGAQQRQLEAARRWKEEVLGKREAFIAQARAAYQPLVTLAPEEVRGEIERRITPQIERLYQAQDAVITARFEQRTDGAPLDLSELPFDRFVERVASLQEELRGFLEVKLADLAQEEPAIRAHYLVNLFVELVRVCSEVGSPSAADTSSPARIGPVRSPELNVPTTGHGAWFHLLGLGWQPQPHHQPEDFVVVDRLLLDLTSYRTGAAPLNMSEATKLTTFLSAASARGAEPHRVLLTQLKKLLNVPLEGRPIPEHRVALPRMLGLLTKLRESFRGVELPVLRRALDDPTAYAELGEARPFVVFLTHEVEPLRTMERVAIPGQDIALPEGGIAISQLMKLEQQRPKRGPDDIVMSLDYLLEHIDTLPAPSETWEGEIRRHATVQRESGAYTAEIAQNSRDATRQLAGELVVDFYLQRREAGEDEYVEEARDNGTGALQEVALLIPTSTKAAAGQVELTGFFGTGKYAIFEDVDRLEIVTKNDARAVQFTFHVIRNDAGVATAIRLTGIRHLSDPSVARGVTIRRIKRAGQTIPELDQMLAQRAWKTFTGLAQDAHFAIAFIEYTGARQPLVVESPTSKTPEVLAEAPLRVATPGRQPKRMDFGAVRLISTKDMPLQVVDKAGLRVGEIKEDYLALVPTALRRHLKELGVNLQIPLPLIRGRSAFEHEAECLPAIQRAVAVAFYRAMAYKTLAQTAPQFVFENFPMDWETNESYWDSIDLASDQAVVELAQAINEGRWDDVRPETLEALLTQAGRLDHKQWFVKLILLVEVADSARPGERVSLLARRLAVQVELDQARAEAQRRALGLARERIPNRAFVPLFGAKLGQAVTIATGHEQMRYPERFVVDPATYTPREHVLVAAAGAIASRVGLAQVQLVSAEVAFVGAFKGETMYLNRALALRLGQADAARGFFDEGTDTIVHELGHLLEQWMRRGRSRLGAEEVYVAHGQDFTHQAVGVFAEAMKYVAAVSLVGEFNDRLRALRETSTHN